ncbi:MAG: hypothetical protein ABIP21_04020 [Acidimicrobiia bacterium]
MTHDDFLDANTAERLLSGAVAAADAPPGYGAVASVLAAAVSPGPVPEMDFEELARAARRTADRPGPSPTRRSPMLGKLLTMKAAAAAGVILIGASGAAAATGTLPGSVQGVAHSTLAHIGVEVPDDDASENSNDSNSDTNDTDRSDDSATTTTTVPADGSVPGASPAVDGRDDTNHDGTVDENDATDVNDDHDQDPAAAPGTTNGDDQAHDDESDADDDGVGTPTPSVPTSDPADDSDDSDDDGDSGHGGSGSGSGSGHGGSDSSDD